MADSKDDAPNPPPAPPSAVADIFNSVTNWSLETLGQPSPRGTATDNPFARPSPQPLASWSLAGAELLDHAPAGPANSAGAALSERIEPAAPSSFELYIAHEKSYDSEGKDHPFIDPCSFALAVRGAPALEASRSNTTSISAASYAKMNLSGDKGGVQITSPGTVTTFGTGDAIASGAASLTANSDREAADKKLSAVWAKLWRY